MSERAQTALDFAIGASVFLVVVAFVLTFVPGIIQPFESSTQQETAAADRLAEQLGSGMLVADIAEPYVLDRGCVATYFALENSDGDPGNDQDAYTDNDAVVRSTLYDITNSDLYDAGACPFSTGQSVFERLAVDGSSLDVSVRLVADVDGDGTPGLLCIDAGSSGDTDKPERSDTIVETSDPYSSGDCDMSNNDNDHDIALETANDPPSGTSSVVLSRRYVAIEGGFADGRRDAALVVEVW
ncbi:hypothetical protein [Halosegnis sp.]|uniref:DUF7287 family protein n=1 Tax=Halosegnis sp. TaxID=2864959 RepID=UPI0035D51664